MKTRAAIAIAAAIMFVVPLQSASAAEVVGVSRVVVPPQTDVHLSLPFSRNPVGEYTVASIVPGSGVTVADVLVPGAYADTYYVRFVDQDAEGLWATIDDNGTGSITLLDPAILNFVDPGDTFRVYEHHTLGSVFPPFMFGKSYVAGTKVLIFKNDLSAMAQNLSADRVATYTTAAGGVWFGSGGVTSATILEPETQFILRNVSDSELQFIAFGKAADFSVSRLVAANGDLNIGTGYPVPVVLKNAGIEGNQRKVLFYDNAASGQNKSASKVASYTTGAGGLWFGNGVTGNELINPSESITFRLPVSEAGTKVTFTKPY
ncbi:MAG: TIGR02597 family protein [Candidatus Omnitrophica bacterium]|nr:TIGR02597 family protein [Candidatus Omnitrophota bacterium]